MCLELPLFGSGILRGCTRDGAALPPPSLWEVAPLCLYMFYERNLNTNTDLLLLRDDMLSKTVEEDAVLELERSIIRRQTTRRSALNAL